MSDCHNSAAMREALGMVLRYLQWLYAQGGTDRGRLSDEIDRIISALAAPPRNCDVGSPHEQADRHRELCLKYGGCSTCPRNKEEWSYKDCILDWEQLPYEGSAK